LVQWRADAASFSAGAPRRVGGDVVPAGSGSKNNQLCPGHAKTRDFLRKTVFCEGTLSKAQHDLLMSMGEGAFDNESHERISELSSGKWFFAGGYVKWFLAGVVRAFLRASYEAGQDKHKQVHFFWGLVWRLRKKFRDCFYRVFELPLLRNAKKNAIKKSS
jgi:hypothetical protein